MNAVATRDPSGATASAGVATAALSLAFCYLGLEAAFPSARYEFGPVSVAYVLAFVLALVGWRTGVVDEFRRYFGWASLFAIWLVVSSIAAWQQHSLQQGLRLVSWFVFIIPGLAWLLKEARNRTALLLGLAAGASVFVVAGSIRLVRGHSVLDVVDGKTLGKILDVNRNAVNMRVLLVLPFALAGLVFFKKWWLRWPFVGLSAVWLVNSGGRSGLAGIFVIAVVYALLQPSAPRRFRVILGVLLAGSTAFAWIQGAGGQASVSTERLIDVIKGERTEADEARELILRKAWDLGSDHPFFGVGLQRFETTYSPAIEKASTRRVRQIALEYSEHNTYAEVLGETGFPGLFLLLFLIGALVASGVESMRYRPVRAATCALCGLAFVVFFHSAMSVLLFLPIAMLLGTVGESKTAGTDKPGAPAQLADVGPSELTRVEHL